MIARNFKINPDLSEITNIGALRRAESEATLGGSKIKENERETVYRIRFNGKDLFDLRATDMRGVEAIPIGVTQQSVEGCNFKYFIGAFKVDFNAPRLEIRQVSDDERGAIFVVQYKGAELYKMLLTNTGFARGGHAHDEDFEFRSVVGTVVWHLEKENKFVVQRAGEPLALSKGDVHYLVALEPSLNIGVPKDGSINVAPSASKPESRAVVDGINARQSYVNKHGTMKSMEDIVQL